MVGCAKLLLVLWSVRQSFFYPPGSNYLTFGPSPSPHASVYPILMAPGYSIRSVSCMLYSLVEIDSCIIIIRSIDERTLVYFADNPRHILEAYIESGEGIDRAGGFAIQVRYPFPQAFFPFVDFL